MAHGTQLYCVQLNSANLTSDSTIETPPQHDSYDYGIKYCRWSSHSSVLISVVQWCSGLWTAAKLLFETEERFQNERAVNRQKVLPCSKTVTLRWRLTAVDRQIPFGKRTVNRRSCSRNFVCEISESEISQTKFQEHVYGTLNFK